MKRTFNRFISALLVAVMLMGLMPSSLLENIDFSEFFVTKANAVDYSKPAVSCNIPLDNLSKDWGWYDYAVYNALRTGKPTSNEKQDTVFFEGSYKDRDGKEIKNKCSISATVLMQPVKNDYTSISKNLTSQTASIGATRNDTFVYRKLSCKKCSVIKPQAGYEYYTVSLYMAYLNLSVDLYDNNIRLLCQKKGHVQVNFCIMTNGKECKIISISRNTKDVDVTFKPVFTYTLDINDPIVKDNYIFIKSYIERQSATVNTLEKDVGKKNHEIANNVTKTLFDGVQLAISIGSMAAGDWTSIFKAIKDGYSVINDIGKLVTSSDNPVKYTEKKEGTYYNYFNDNTKAENTYNSKLNSGDEKKLRKERWKNSIKSASIMMSKGDLKNIDDYYRIEFELDSLLINYSFNKKVPAYISFDIYEGEKRPSNYYYKILDPFETDNFKFNSIGRSFKSTSNNIETTLKTTIKNDNKDSIQSYGVYLRKNNSSFTTGDKKEISSNKTSKKSISVEKAYKLEPKTTYWYRFYANVGGITYYSKTKSFKTPQLAPAKPSTPTLSSNEIAKNGNIKITWKPVDLADSYNVKITNTSTNKVIYKNGLGSTSLTYTFNDSGTYKICVQAVNSIGKGDWSDSKKATVHDKVKVVLKNGDKEFYNQKVKWGTNVKLDSNPTKKGYEFKGWIDANGNEVSLKNVKSKITAYAKFEKTKKEVTFKDTNGKTCGVSATNTSSSKMMSKTSPQLLRASDSQLVDTQTVLYGEAAIPPTDYIPTPGYEFVGWDQKFDCVTEDMVITAVERKINNNLPVKLQVLSAIRENYGYVVTCSVENIINDDAQGRIVVALKTKDGKMVTTSESYAFYLRGLGQESGNSNTSRTVVITVPLNNDDPNMNINAEIAEVYAVEKFRTTVPVSKSVTVNVTDNDPWTEFYTDEQFNVLGQKFKEQCESVAAASSDNVQTKSEYRESKKVKKTTTSITELDSLIDQGWIDVSVAGETKTSSWQDTKPDSAQNRKIETRKVDDGTYTYWYKRYVYYNKAAGANYISYSDSYANSMGYTGKWEYKSVTKPLTKSGTIDGKDYYGDMWYRADVNGKSKHTTYKVANQKTQYRSIDNLYRVEMFGDWSEWTETNLSSGLGEPTVIDGTETWISADGSRRVEQRVLTRYKARTAEFTAEYEHDICDEYTQGYLGEDYAGKQVVLCAYKVTEASDWTIEALEQTTVDGDGYYNFDPYILREMLTTETGDYTVTLGVEGSNAAIMLGKIYAPLPEYSVKYQYVNAEGQITPIEVTLENGSTVTEQMIIKGSDATTPEAPEIEGKTFSHWDMRSTNITQDTIINAIYDINSYDVTFIDWNGDYYSEETYIHGDALRYPSNYTPGDTEDSAFVGWSETESAPVTSNMVVYANYNDKVFDVEFYDAEGNLLTDETQQLTYGETPEFPILEDTDTIIYDGTWSAVIEGVDDILPDEESTGLPEDPDAIDEDEIIDDSEDLNEYEPDEEEVTLDVDSSEIEDETIAVAVNLDTLESGELDVINNTKLYPNFYYVESTEEPTVSVETGSYSSAQNVRIDCETEKAIIYYTLDGTDPHEDTALECMPGDTINITSTCILRYYASCFNKNNSTEKTETYVINNGTQPDQCILKIGDISSDSYYGLYVVDKGSKLTDKQIPDVYGYSVDAIYQNYEYVETEEDSELVYSNEWNIATDMITQDTTLYVVTAPLTYTVTFLDYDGIVIEETEATYLSSVYPPTPERDGYVFTGWTSDAYETVTEDIEVTAVYVKEEDYVTISLNRDEYNTMVGSSFTLIPTTTGNVENPTIEWYGSDEDVAVVDENGKVTATGAGVMVVEAVVLESGETATCIVYVEPNPSEELVLNKDSELTIYDDNVIGFTITTDEDDHYAPTVASVKNEFKSNGLVFRDKNGKVMSDTDHITTDTTIQLVYNGEVLDTLTAAVCGDVDCDGYVTNKDASMISRYLVDKETADYAQQLAMDVNADGYINNRDAALIARYLVGKETI